MFPPNQSMIESQRCKNQSMVERVEYFVLRCKITSPFLHYTLYAIRYVLYIGHYMLLLYYILDIICDILPPLIRLRGLKWGLLAQTSQWTQYQRATPVCPTVLFIITLSSYFTTCRLLLLAACYRSSWESLIWLLEYWAPQQSSLGSFTTVMNFLDCFPVKK